MFALRILVPVLLTVAVGYWLEKRLNLEQPETIELAEPTERRAARGEGAVKIGPAVPCWDLKGCSLSARVECPAYARPNIPCWLAKELAVGQLNAECFDCDQYRSHFATGRPQLRVIKGGQGEARQISTG